MISGPFQEKALFTSSGNHGHAVTEGREVLLTFVEPLAATSIWSLRPRNVALTTRMMLL